MPSPKACLPQPSRVERSQPDSRPVCRRQRRDQPAACDRLPAPEGVGTHIDPCEVIETHPLLRVFQPASQATFLNLKISPYVGVAALVKKEEFLCAPQQVELFSHGHN